MILTILLWLSALLIVWNICSTFPKLSLHICRGLPQILPQFAKFLPRACSLHSRNIPSLRITKYMKEGKFEITAPVVAGPGLYSHLLKTNRQLFFLPDNLSKLWILWLATTHGLSRGGYVYSSDQIREVNYLSTSLPPNPHPNLHNMLTQHKKTGKSLKSLPKRILWYKSWLSSSHFLLQRYFESKQNFLTKQIFVVYCVIVSFTYLYTTHPVFLVILYTFGTYTLHIGRHISGPYIQIFLFFGFAWQTSLRLPFEACMLTFGHILQCGLTGRILYIFLPPSLSLCTVISHHHYQRWPVLWMIFFAQLESFSGGMIFEYFYIIYLVHLWH